MKSPLLIIGLLGGGAYLLTKKPKTTTTSITEKKDLPSVEDSDLPDVEKEEDLPSLEDEDKPNIPDEDDENILIKLEDYYDPFIQNDGEQPGIVDPKTLWISNTCLSWGVGKQFVKIISLPEKYLYQNPKDPDKLITPAQYWLSIDDGNWSPAPLYLNDLISDAPGRAFAAQVIDRYNKCNITLPRRKLFKTYTEYKIVLNNFSQTPLGKLFDYLSKVITDQMYKAWATKYPSSDRRETIKAWALYAIRLQPMLSATVQTDIAYKKLAESMPDAPAKLDPKNPAHKTWINLWQQINIEVKNYRGLIKQYGLD